MAEVADFDLDAREVRLRAVGDAPAPSALAYDTLIVAGGSQYSYFGHDEWREHAAEVKSLESALVVRSRLLERLRSGRVGDRPEERATRGSRSSSSAPARPASRWRGRSESSRATRFAATSGTSTRGRLGSCSSRPSTASSPAFPAKLSAKAARSLEKLGVTVLLGRTVVGMDGGSVTVDEERIETRTVDLGRGRHRVEPRDEARRADRGRS